MRLNGIAPAPGAKKTHKRVGRGIGSGLGKTAGRGHKGQHARSGGFRKVGFEGGQMPLQRRVPKRGFRSMHKGERAELRLEQAAKAAVAGIVDRDALKARRLVRGEPEIIKIVAGGEISEPLVLRGLAVSRGARAAIEAAGGKVED